MINTPEKALQKDYNQLPPSYERQVSEMHPALQFLTFAALIVFAVFLGYLIGAGIVLLFYGMDPVVALSQLNLSAPHVTTALWIIQVTSTTIPLFIVPVFFAYVIVKNTSDYLKPTFKFPIILLLLVFCIMFISSPIIEYLSNINQKMVLPPFLKWMREKEDQAQKITAVLLKMDNVWDMIVNVLAIGLLTAIAEEFMFRGVIQTIFMRWTKNVHAAVWITAILFSAFHMEFFGFLPRLFLGSLFGYFVAWSGSIWPAVWAHFINNGTAVVVTYLFQHKKITMNPDDQHLFNSAGYIISLVIVLFLMYMYRTITTPKPEL